MVETVNRLCQAVTNTRNRTDHVSTWTQVSHFTQIFNRMTRFRHWVSIGIFNPTDDFYVRRSQFECLA
ncbi:Uncharacterised protein [Vibrio cholerae]|nr:Uncharacterised protein [Vibrio cholerae]CSI43495.1 Uncharacterised protein [Vibrio cholerae]CSI95427.1 Uncharacterised protein [Vibrio cholerae]